MELVDGSGLAPVALAAEASPTPERRALAVFLESAGWAYDNERIADALIREFGSLKAVAAGSRRRMTRVAGEGVTRLLLAHARLIGCGLVENVAARSILADRDALFAFLRHEIAFAPEERLLALFLDARLGLIKAEIVASGTVSGVCPDFFTLFQRGKELGAAAIILAHNHPSLDTRPSDADIIATNRLKRIAHDLEMPLLDHFIVSPGQITQIPMT